MATSGKRVDVILPEVPDSWADTFDSLRFEIHCPMSSPGEGTVSILYASPGESITLRVPREGWVPILAVPVAEHPGRGTVRLKPAGGFTEIETDEEPRRSRFLSPVVVLDWRDGCLAGLLLDLYTSSSAYPGFNIPRLVESVDTFIEDEAEGDAWVLDSESIMRGLLYGTMNHYTIRRDTLRSLELPLAPGQWFRDNPLAWKIDAEGGPAELDSLTEGRHLLFLKEGAATVSIHIGRQEWFAVYSATEEYISGTW